jgi:hypothetical protein
MLKNNYENRIVLFLDILGFKKIIEKTVSNSDKVEVEVVKETFFLIQTIKEMVEDAHGNSKKSSRMISQFSDSIIVSFNVTDLKEIPRLFYDLLRLISKLVARGMLCRGAISYGLLYHKDNLIFGPALVDAYETESQGSIYPRVILDKTVLDVMRMNYSLEATHKYRLIIFEANVQSYLKVDTDDKFYLDYFSGLAMFFENDQLLDVYKNLRQMIIKGLKNKSPNINIKFGWMRNKFNKIPVFFEDLDRDEDLFFKRPDVKNLYDNFKYINN